MPISTNSRQKAWTNKNPRKTGISTVCGDLVETGLRPQLQQILRSTHGHIVTGNPRSSNPSKVKLRNFHIQCLPRPVAQPQLQGGNAKSLAFGIRLHEGQQGAGALPVDCDRIPPIAYQRPGEHHPAALALNPFKDSKPGFLSISLIPRGALILAAKNLLRYPCRQPLFRFLRPHISTLPVSLVLRLPRRWPPAHFRTGSPHRPCA